jgi:LAS superfamily LD-carboxypeptidase LdcB
MHRRDYLKLQSLGLAALVVPQFDADLAKRYSIERLMGLDAPKLFGQENTQLSRRAFKAFNKMKMAAWNDGILIKTVSSYRSHRDQKRIFERKFNSFTKEGDTGEQAIERIIEYSTIPGTSRHHWATDIDIIQAGKPIEGDSLLAKHFAPEGAFFELKEWLDTNASDFDFYLVYTDNPSRKGFKYEPWHLSYAPESVPLLKHYLKKEVVKLALEQQVEGFSFLTPERIDRYLNEHVLGINGALLP